MAPSDASRAASGRPRAAQLLLAGMALGGLLASAGCQNVAMSKANAGAPPTTTAAAPSSAAPTVPPPPPVPPKPVVALAGLAHGRQLWDRPLTVHVHHGRLLSLQAVDLSTGETVPGSTFATGWVADGTEVPDRDYRLVATVRGQDGGKVRRTLAVRTSAPDATVDTSVAPYGDATVGVGEPIIVLFSHRVTDRAAATAALTVSTSVPVTGAWRWFSATEVHWRPKEYWPAHTKVTLHDDLLGVQVAPGVWGLRSRDLHFSIGDAHVTTVDIATQTMTVRSNGTVLATYPVSTGRAAYPTKGGVHIVLNKAPSVVMDSRTVGIPKTSPDFYYEKVLWDVRISDGGAFVHYAPWSVRSQGRRPVSHGCVNVNLAPAIAFYQLSVPGDVVDVVNATAPPNRNDPGMADWN